MLKYLYHFLMTLKLYLLSPVIFVIGEINSIFAIVRNKMELSGKVLKS
jgi:hypothetical protein